MLGEICYSELRELPSYQSANILSYLEVMEEELSDSNNKKQSKVVRMYFKELLKYQKKTLDNPEKL